MQPTTEQLLRIADYTKQHDNHDTIKHIIPLSPASFTWFVEHQYVAEKILDYYPENNINDDTITPMMFCTQQTNQDKHIELVLLKNAEQSIKNNKPIDCDHINNPLLTYSNNTTKNQPLASNSIQALIKSILDPLNEQPEHIINRLFDTLREFFNVNDNQCKCYIMDTQHTETLEQSLCDMLTQHLSSTTLKQQQHKLFWDNIFNQHQFEFANFGFVMQQLYPDAICKLGHRELNNDWVHLTHLVPSNNMYQSVIVPSKSLHHISSTQTDDLIRPITRNDIPDSSTIVVNVDRNSLIIFTDSDQLATMAKQYQT